MSRAISYVVNAPPEVVLEALSSSMAPGSWSGLYFGDRSRKKFIGQISANGEFDLRVARGFFSNYSGYTWLRGSVNPRDVRSVVVAHFSPHALMRFGIWFGIFLFVLLSAALVLAALRRPAFLGAFPVLLIIPMLLFFAGRSFRRDQELLRNHLEAELGRFGPLRTESAG